MIKVFIENEAGSDQKNIFHEKTLVYRKRYRVSRAYPYPYGFILQTTSGDGDNVDCFIMTKQKLRTGQVVECQPIGLMEQLEDGHVDHNVLAVLPDESVELNEVNRQELTEFVTHVFQHRPEKKVTVGRFLNADAAREFIEQHEDGDASLRSA